MFSIYYCYNSNHDIAGIKLILQKRIYYIDTPAKPKYALTNIELGLVAHRSIHTDIPLELLNDNIHNIYIHIYILSIPRRSKQYYTVVLSKKIIAYNVCVND